MNIERGTYAEYVTWLQAKPECVRQLAAEFEIGSAREFRGTVLYILGHREDDVLIMSPHDPGKDAERAISTRVYVCAQGLRTAQA